MILSDEHTPRILLTGATGFVGPYLVNALRRHPRFKHAKIHIWHYLPQESGAHAPMNVDIRNAEAVTASIKSLRPTHVVHLAAQSHVPTSFAHPHLTWNVNVMGTLNLFEALKQHAPEAGIIYISSAEVYGASFQNTAPVDETAVLQPQNPYAASKAAADIMAGQYAALGMRIIRLRPFNHIGPGQSEQFVASAFASQVARIEAGLQAPVIHVGNLDARRDFLDVRDVVRAYVLALEHSIDLPPGCSINLCSGIPVRIADLLARLLELSSCSIEIECDPERMRPSDIPVAVGSNAVATEVLGWTPRYCITETLQQLLHSWRQHVALAQAGV